MGFIGTTEHWFARVAHEVKISVLKATANPQDGKNVIKGAAAVAEGLEPEAAIAIAALDSGMEAAWGKICAAVHSGQDVAKTGYLQIPADAAFEQSVKDAIKSLELLKPGTLAVADAIKSAKATAAPAPGQPPAPTKQ